MEPHNHNNVLENITKMRIGLFANGSSTSPERSYSQESVLSNVVQIRLPFLGKLQCVKDTKGLSYLMFVLCCWIYTTASCLFIILIPAYRGGYVSIFFILFYILSSLLTILSLLRISTLQPGQIIEDDSQLTRSSQEGWTKCRVCNKWRPPKAHHCRRCQQCVARMDHHCPWVNNCIGEENHYAFMLMVLYALIFSSLSFVLCMLYYFVYPSCQQCNHEVLYMRYSAWLMCILTAETATFIVCLFMLFLNQHLNLLLDRTYIDTLTQPRPDPTTLHLQPTCSAYRKLCGTSSVLCWFVPWRRKVNYHMLQGSNV